MRNTTNKPPDPATKTTGGARRDPDWARAAALLSAGSTIAAAARAIGVSRHRLSRRREVDPIFDQRTPEPSGASPAAANRAPAGGGAGRPDALASTVMGALEREVKSGNVRVMMWLAEKLGVLRGEASLVDAGALRLDAMIRSLDDDALREFQALGEVEKE